MTDWIAEQRAAALPNAAQLGDYRDYARGRHALELSPGERRILSNALKHLMTDNLCRTALQALTNPLKIVRFDVDGDGPLQEAKQQYLERVALLNALPTLSKAVHWAMLRDGDHALGLSWHAPTGRVILQRESWWNGVQGVFVAYDDADRVSYAVKEWQTGETWRRTVWWPDRIERYARESFNDDWQPFVLESDGGMWPVPWLDSRGQPLNPPIVHFANVQLPNDGRGDGEEDAAPDSRYGTSELDGGPMGIQDAVNSIHLDVLGAAKFTGFPMLGLMGFQPQVDANGNEVPFVVEPGAVIRSSDASSRVERIQPGSLAELERALTIELQAFSRATTVPVHKLIAGNDMSGVSRILSMLDYFDKLEGIINAAAPAWASVMHKATRLANTFGKAGLDEQSMISAVYAPVIRYDPLTQAQIVQAVAPFVSRREKLRLLDYSTQEQDRILTEMDEDDAASVEGQRALAETARTRALTQAEQASMAEGMTGIAARIQAAAGGA